MHLHSLTFQAVGPFPGRHRIDLATLGSAGIFLLDGPTGAGKSTIIDTIVFALYGKVASDAASDDRLRSAFAPGDVESFVDLVLEVPAGIFRVRRTPEYRRPKKRGQGTTTQHASVRLWRLASVPTSADDDPAGELLSSRLDEAGAEIQRLVGLDRRQFVQTVVLPQGEFASFLRADPEKRRDLLQKVFGTELYERAAVRLGELARAARADVDAARQGVVGTVDRFTGAVGLEPHAARALGDAARDDARLRRATEAEVEAVLAATVAARVDDDTASRGDDTPSGGVARGAVSGQSGDVPVGAVEPDVAGSSGVVPGDAVERDVVGDVAGEAAVTVGLHALVLARARRADARAGELAADERAANATLAALRQALDVEREVAAAIERRSALQRERARLDGRAPQIERSRARLDAARRAAVVAPAARAALTAQRALAAALEQQELARAGAPPALATADASTLEAVRSGVVTASVRVARLLPVGAALPSREQELADGRKEVARAAEERARVLAELAERPARRDELRTRLDALGEAASRLGELQEQELRARTVAGAAHEARAVERELDDAVTDRSRAATVASAAVETEGRVRAARIAGIAGELAGDLVASEPCPVCGSPEHPRPAALSEDRTTPEEVDRAERERAAAEARLAEAATRVATLSERLDAARRAADGCDVRTAEARVDALRAEVSAAQDARSQHADVERALDAHDEATAALHARAAELAEAVGAGTSRLDELAVAVAADRSEIARETAAALSLLGQPDDVLAATGPEGGARNPVAEIAAALDAHARSVAALSEAVDAVASTRADADRRAAEVATLVVEHGFADAAEAVDAVLTDPERATLDGEVARHDADVAAVRAGLADETLAGLAPDAVADVDTALAAVERAETAARAAARRHELAVDRATAARDGADDVASAVDAWFAARAAAAPVTRMAGLAAGTGSDNVHALSLATFVLVQRFEDVVAAANERLAEMSSGRYELVRSASREDVRSRRTGLAMKVVDHVTARERDPRTLSGGETFYVSLCLALGLADVVTAEAGGVELGTLFVDEGFGSLDAETLDVVLAALGRLRAGGRVVGVVSHVEALKQAVAERVEVRPVAGGGSTLSVRA